MFVYLLQIFLIQKTEQTVRFFFLSYLIFSLVLLFIFCHSYLKILFYVNLELKKH